MQKNYLEALLVFRFFNYYFISVTNVNENPLLPSFCHIPRSWITKCLSLTDTLGFNSDLSDPFGFPWQRPRGCRKRLEHHRGASLILKFCNRTPDFRTKMEPIQHPLPTRPGSASRPVSSQRMPVIGESDSRARTWQQPVFSLPRQMIATPGMEVLSIHPALEGKISFSARFRTERKAQAGIPALNQRRGNPQPSFAARHRPGATGEESPTQSPLFHAWPSSPDTPSSLLAAQVVRLLLGSLEGSHTGPGGAPPVPRSKEALLAADSLLNPSSSAGSGPAPYSPTRLRCPAAQRRKGGCNSTHLFLSSKHFAGFQRLQLGRLTKCLEKDTLFPFPLYRQRKGKEEVGRHELPLCVALAGMAGCIENHTSYEMIFEKCYSFPSYHPGKSKYFEAEFNQQTICKANVYLFLSRIKLYI